MGAYIEILHNNTSITTLQGFVDENFIKLDEKFTLLDLMNYEGNSSRISSAYLTNPTATTVDRLESPVLLRVPSQRISKDIVVTAGNLVFPNNDFACFLGDEIEKIVTNEGYKSLNVGSKSKLGDETAVYRIANNATVWVWCKGLGERDEKGVLMNVTPFVESITTNVNKNGGNFSVKLAPLLASYERAFSYQESKGWSIDDKSLNRYVYRNKENFVTRQAVHGFSHGEKRRNKLFFHFVISANDVVFIQFETLEMEQAERAKDYSVSLYKSTSELPGRNWDMIGLVDSNRSSYNAAAADMSVEITGRDLMKIIIEDGCYFFPFDFATEKGGFVNASAENKGTMKRLINGELSFFNAYVDRTIEYTIRFVLNQLSNIKIVDDALFQFYTDKVYRYDIYDTKPETQDKNGADFQDYENAAIYKKVFAPGIWQAVRLIVDGEISNRRIVDSSISSDSGSLISFVKKVCQEPFVEFWGDTYGDKYFWVVRKPPFTEAAIKSYLNKGLVYTIPEDLIYSDSLSFEEAEVYSWYRLTPKGNFFGDGGGMTLAEFPAVYFEEYADIWGSRPLQVVTNYIDYQGISNADKGVDLQFLEDQAIQDLAFLIETNAYMPFTRKGTITCLGDRRVKRGTFIRHGGTGEIFHVDGVSQTYTNSNNTDRTTTIQVSRGMVEGFINSQNAAISYFNIIDLDKDPLTGKSRSNNFKLNAEVFEFFIQRRQFKI